MSDKLPPKSSNNSEEVDLGQLFNAIGRVFEKFFVFIGNIFKGLFKLIIYALKPIVAYFKIIAILLLVSALVGYLVEKFEKPVYVSDMLVKPYFESKYQLANNVNYFNALISSDNLPELSRIFEIDTTTASELLGFDIEIGPETQNDLLKEYNDYIETIDSALVKDIPYEEYVENRDILSGSIFSITAKSRVNNIFTSLEKGFEKTFKNKYSEKLKDIRDSTIVIRTNSYKTELRRIDSLQRIYLEVLKNESENGKVALGFESMMPLAKEKTFTREFDLFKEEQIIRDSLKMLQQQMVAKNDYFDILSGFEEVGRREQKVLKDYSIIFPAITILIIILIYIIFKVFNFIKDYE